MFQNIRQMRWDFCFEALFFAIEEKEKKEKIKVVKTQHQFVPSIIKELPNHFLPPGDVNNYVHRQHRRNARTLHGILFCHSCRDFLFPLKHFP